MVVESDHLGLMFGYLGAMSCLVLSRCSSCCPDLAPLRCRFALARSGGNMLFNASWKCDSCIRKAWWLGFPFEFWKPLEKFENLLKTSLVVSVTVYT